MKKKLQAKALWKSVRKNAPRVPDITCPAIDEVIRRLDQLSSTTQRLTAAQCRTLTKHLEKLRRQNERLRSCGHYWHDACKSLLEKIFNKPLQ